MALAKLRVSCSATSLGNRQCAAETCDRSAVLVTHQARVILPELSRRTNDDRTHLEPTPASVGRSRTEEYSAILGGACDACVSLDRTATCRRTARVDSGHQNRDDPVVKILGVPSVGLTVRSSLYVLAVGLIAAVGYLAILLAHLARRCTRRPGKHCVGALLLPRVWLPGLDPRSESIEQFRV